MSLRCRVGWHTRGWERISFSWVPDLRIRICTECETRLYVD